MHPQEPEARLMPCEGRTDRLQRAGVVDAQAGIIVAEDAVTAEAETPVGADAERGGSEPGTGGERDGAGGGTVPGSSGGGEARGYEVLWRRGWKRADRKRGE